MHHVPSQAWLVSGCLRLSEETRTEKHTRIAPPRRLDVVGDGRMVCLAWLTTASTAPPILMKDFGVLMERKRENKKKEGQEAV